MLYEVITGGNAPTHAERQGTETDLLAADANPGVLVLKRNRRDRVAGIAGLQKIEETRHAVADGQGGQRRFQAKGLPAQVLGQGDKIFADGQLQPQGFGKAFFVEQVVRVLEEFQQIGKQGNGFEDAQLRGRVGPVGLNAETEKIVVVQAQLREK